MTTSIEFLKRPILYLDMLQSESRALVSFLRVAKIDYETRVFKSREEMASSEEFKALNPSLTIPFLQSEVNVSGGHTIARYLAETRLDPANHFYPSSDANPALR
jgi:glutathione S-transferase